VLFWLASIILTCCLCWSWTVLDAYDELVADEAVPPLLPQSQSQSQQGAAASALYQSDPCM
jgi:hypothetical protein